MTNLYKMKVMPASWKWEDDLSLLADALKCYELPPPGFQHACMQTELGSRSCDKALNTDPMRADFLFSSFIQQFEKLTGPNQTEILELLFSIACKTHEISSLPHRYIHNSLSAMRYLQSRSKSNILDGAARVFGNMRRDKSDSMFPTKRMPFGLLEYCINFYSSKSCSEVPACSSCNYESVSTGFIY